MSKSVKAVNSPQVKKGGTFHVHLLMEGFCIVVEKYISRQGLRLGLVLNLFLIFYQISGSCSYEIVHRKKGVIAAQNFKNFHEQPIGFNGCFLVAKIRMADRLIFIFSFSCRVQ